MALTDEQIVALGQLGQLASKIISLKSTLGRVTGEITRMQSEKTNLQSRIQVARTEFQDMWEVLRQ